MEKRKTAIHIWSIFLGLAMIIFAFTPVYAEQKPITLRIAHGPTQTGSHMISLAWKQLCEKYSDSIRLSLIPAKSWLANQMLMEAGATDLCWATGFQLSWQVQGIKDFKDKQFSDPRLLWCTVLVPYHIIVPKDSPIKKIEDMKGKKVVTLPPGSAAHNMSLALFDAAGIKVNLHHAGVADSKTGLKDGTYDALAMGITIGSPAFVELFNTMPCRLIPLPEGLWQKINSAYSDQFLYIKVPAGIYRGVDKETKIFATPGFLLANKNIPENVIYELCKIWWEHTDEAIAIHKRACGNASRKDYVVFEAAVPRHPGALKYFKETGVLK